jgi:two-component system response regulator AtoC
MNILIVDDEAAQVDMLKGFLEKQGHEPHTASGGKEALALFMEKPFDLILLDHRMDGMNGDEVLEKLKKIEPGIRVIMITAFSEVETAVKVMRLGADDFLEKPIDLMELLEKINLINEELLISNDVGTVDESIVSESLPVAIIGQSKPVLETISIISRAAPSPWTVLLKGESGTGKELFANLLHQLSPRKKNSFIELNCAAVPESLFESELFGHEKGAFSGASNRRRGAFEQADGGTLFLDEIGEMPMAMQPKLLRALQEQTINRVGSEQSIKIDIRVVAASNRDLKKMVEKGNFREDLYFRLNVIEVEIPPLRERKEDIEPLINYFLDKFKPEKTFSRQAMHQLNKYNFPGNVRELEHIIQRTITLTRSSLINLSDLPPEIRNLSEKEAKTEKNDLNQRLAQVEEEMLKDALEKHNWVQTRAAESLGISERVLRYKMEKAGFKKGK